MSVLRLVIAWLVMAALPLQGLAAASMLFCDQAAHATVATPAAHDHAAHGDDGGAGHDDSAAVQAHDDGHACPICASCCNLVALSETPILSGAAESPSPQPVQGPMRVLTRHEPTPDKPPRA